MLVLQYVWNGDAIVTVHNFSEQEQRLDLTIELDGGALLCDLFDQQHSKAGESGRHELQLAPYMHKRFRVGGPDIGRHHAPPDALAPEKETAG